MVRSRLARAKAVSPLRSATAVHDATRDSAVGLSIPGHDIIEAL